MKSYSVVFCLLWLVYSCKKDPKIECATPPKVALCDTLKDIQQATNWRVFPNPASSYFVIDYELADSAYVKINLLDITGNERKVIVDSYERKGYYYRSILVDSTLENGSYILNFQLCNNNAAKRIIISK
jgi:hypothetical protein